MLLFLQSLNYQGTLSQFSTQNHCVSNRDPDRIRTYDLLLRRQLLYPAELRDRKFRVDLFSRIYKSDFLRFAELNPNK